MPETGSIERISFNQLRAMLRQGLEEVLVLLPESDEPAIQMACHDGRQFVPIGPGERMPIGLLRDFASAVLSLSEGRRSADEVREILVGKGVAQMIFSDDESWYQLYVD